MTDYLGELPSAARHTYADYFGDAFQALFMTCLHVLYSRAQWLWQEWNLQMTFHNLLWICTPDLCSLPLRISRGTESLSDTYGLEPRILWFLFIVPPILGLLLVSVFIMDAGNDEPVVVPLSLDKTKDEHASQSSQSGKHGHGQTRLCKESARGNKAMSYPLRSNHVSSWGPMLGSMGFYGGEIMAYKPIDITAIMKETPVHDDHRHSAEDNQNSWGTIIGTYGFYGAEVSNHAPYSHLAGKNLGRLLQGDPVQTRTRTYTRSAAGETLAAIAADCMSDTSFETFQGTAAVRVPNVVEQHPASSQKQKQDQKQPAFTAKDNAFPSKLGFFQSVMEIEPDDDDTNSDLSEYPPLPYGFEHDGLTGVIDRMMEKTNSMNDHARRATIHWTPTTLKLHDQQQQQEQNIPSFSDAAKEGKGRSIGSKIMDITYRNRLSRDLDAISGGLLGTAIFTVAALVSTAETSVNFLNEHLPDSVKGILEELKESTIRMMHDPCNADEKDSGTSSMPEKGGAQGISDYVPSKAVPKSYAAAVADTTSLQPNGSSQDQASLSSTLTKTYAAVVADATSDDAGALTKTYAAVVADATSDGADAIPMSYAAVVADATSDGADATPMSYAAVVADATSDGAGATPMSYTAVVATGPCTGANMDDITLKGNHAKADGEDADECNESDQGSQGSRNNDDMGHHHKQVKTHSGSHRRHKHTHHLVIHPHDEVDLTHHHHHQETMVEKQEHEQEQDLTRHQGQEQGQVVEYTIDEHGNKVPVTEERRDSGFDMLS